MFISGLQSLLKRKHLLENRTLDLATTFDQLRTLDSAQRNCELYTTTQPHWRVNALTPDQNINENITIVMVAVGAKYGFVVFHSIHAQNAQHLEQYAIDVR